MKIAKKICAVIVFVMASFFLLVGQCEEFLLIPSVINWAATCALLFFQM